MASLELRNENYRVVFRFGGQKFARSLNTDDRRQADLALARLEDNLRRLKLGTLALDPGADIPTILLSSGAISQRPKVKRVTLLGELLDHVISVDGIKVNKPNPRVYELVEEQMSVKPSNVLFVSSNAWDAHAAAHFGFNVIWLNRTGQPDERLPGAFAARGTQLADVAKFLKA